MMPGRPMATNPPADGHRRGILSGSACEPAFVLGVTDGDFDEGRVAFGEPNGCAVADDPEHQACEPKAQAECQHGGEGPDQNGGGTRGAADQNRFRQRAVEHEFKTFRAHQISAPPPNEKNDRKKELAANAIERPNTTW